LRVFLDTNVLVSAFSTRGLCADLLRVVLTEHTLVTGEVVLQELTRVLRTRLKLPQDAVGEIEEFLREGEVVPKPIEPAPWPSRDKADRWILASAIAARADVLVTGDDDFLSIAGELPIKVVAPRGFWEIVCRP